MRSIRSLASSVLGLVGVVGLVACGDDAGSSVDARILDDAGPGIDSPLPGNCDYVESDDPGNDDVSASGTPEATGQSLTAARPIVLCGNANADHFNDADDVVDVDGFVVQLPAGPILVSLSGMGLETLGAAKLGVYSGTGFTDIEAEEPLVGSHAVVMLDLPAGAYELALIAENNAPITTNLAYKIQIGVDTPAARCPKITGAANHSEGTGANDVVAISYTGGTSITLTPGANDAPEPTGISLLPNLVARISGGIAATGQTGDYKDPDTYAFTTGGSVDSLTIRLNWTGTADLDWFLFEGNVPPVASKATSALAEDEMLTVAVRPNTTYWIFTGMYKDSTAPMLYDLSLCGATFTPP